MKKIAYFITSHGYGHAVRSSYLINRLIKNSKVVIITKIPQSFFQEEIEGDFEYIYDSFDLGCIQVDALKVDQEQTVKIYKEIYQDNHLRLDDVVKKLYGVDLIISDIVPFASTVALALGVESIAISNFWWSDIYGEFKVEGGAKIEKLVLSEMENFSRYVILDPPMREYNLKSPTLRGVNLLRVGRDLREQFLEYYSIDPTKRVALLYIGGYGMDSVNWSQLEELDQWVFVALNQIPTSPSNSVQIGKEKFNMQDITASVDVVISKLGYGTVTESLASGTPILYTPRVGFSEYEVLKDFITPWGGSTCLDEESFNSLKWESALDSLYKRGKRQKRLKDHNGEIAKWIALSKLDVDASDILEKLENDSSIK